MKFICFLTTCTTAVLFLLYACNGPAEHAATSRASATSAENRIYFNVNGDPVKSSGWNLSRFDMGQGVGINVTSNMHEEIRTVAFNINGQSIGTYSLNEDSGAAYGSYKPDYADLSSSF